MTKTEQFEIASNWFEHLKQRNLEQLVSLYSDTQLSFHPTLWNEHIRNRARARDYFISFFAKRPRVHTFDGDFLSLGERAFLYSGTMKLEFETQNHDTKDLGTVRFSFVWAKGPDNHWRITHHHNSVVPKT